MSRSGYFLIALIFTIIGGIILLYGIQAPSTLSNITGVLFTILGMITGLIQLFFPLPLGAPAPSGRVPRRKLLSNNIGVLLVLSAFISGIFIWSVFIYASTPISTTSKDVSSLKKSSSDISSPTPILRTPTTAPTKTVIYPSLASSYSGDAYDDYAGDGSTKDWSLLIDSIKEDRQGNINAWIGLGGGLGCQGAITGTIKVDGSVDFTTVDFTNFTGCNFDSLHFIGKLTNNTLQGKWKRDAGDVLRGKWNASANINY